MTLISEDDIRAKIRRLRTPRAGSIFPNEFERGWIFGMLFCLNEQPHLDTHQDVLNYINRQGREEWKKIKLEEKIS